MRISDSRLGRFLSVDPVTKSYPMLTPYQFASNKPINGVDLDGKEFVLTIFDPTTANEFELAVNTYGDIYKARQIAFDAINSKMSESDFKKLKTAKPMGWAAIFTERTK